MRRKRIVLMKMYSVYMPEKLWQDVQDIAEKEGVSASNLLRTWISAKVKSHLKKGEKGDI